MSRFLLLAIGFLALGHALSYRDSKKQKQHNDKQHAKQQNEQQNYPKCKPSKTSDQLPHDNYKFTFEKWYTSTEAQDEPQVVVHWANRWPAGESEWRLKCVASFEKLRKKGYFPSDKTNGNRWVLGFSETDNLCYAGYSVVEAKYWGPDEGSILGLPSQYADILARHNCSLQDAPAPTVTYPLHLSWTPSERNDNEPNLEDLKNVHFTLRLKDLAQDVMYLRPGKNTVQSKGSKGPQPSLWTYSGKGTEQKPLANLTSSSAKVMEEMLTTFAKDVSGGKIEAKHIESLRNAAA